MTIEKAAGIEVSERVQVILRLWMSFSVLILTSSSSLASVRIWVQRLHSFIGSAREMILDIFEETCGGRLIINYNMIGGVSHDLHPNFQKRVKRVYS